MSQSLYPYYERELAFIRQAAEDFAKQYPAAASRLRLEPDHSADPHVERLIESFALLSGRVRRKLDDEFPELTDAMLGTLYPHYLAPVPSMTVVQFELDPARAQLPSGFVIDRHSRLRTAAIEGLACRYHTGWPTTLWPLRLADAQYLLPPLPPGLQAPPKASAVLRLRLEVIGGLSLEDLRLDRLRVFLDGDPETVAVLYELLLNHVIRVALIDPDASDSKPLIELDPNEAIRPVGFGREEALLPCPGPSMPGYLLLSEFFAFPSKFHFLDLVGLGLACRAGFGKRLEVVISLDRGPTKLEQLVDDSTFRLGCVPAVNLFEQTAEPIVVSGTRFEYRIVPDVAYPDGLEIFSIESVTGVEPSTGSTTEYQPLYAFNAQQYQYQEQAESPRAFWLSSRQKSERADDRGTEVFLRLVDLGFDPSRPAESTLVVRTTCTNRDLPLILRQAGERLAFALERAAPLSAIRCIRPPSAPRRPPLRRGAYWRLISHLNLNHLSISDPVAGTEALREILRLYTFDVSDPSLGRSAASIAQRQIEGISSVSSQRVVRRIGSEVCGGFARGLEITIEFDEEAYVGTGTYFFASVLEQFLGMYVSINSFTQLVARLEQSGTTLKIWPPRSGDRPLI